MASGRSDILSVSKLFCLMVLISRYALSRGAANFKCSNLEKVFTDCPCLADEVNNADPVVDCSNKELQEVPTIATSYPNVIYKLILKNNKITSLKDGSFQGLKIQHLDLTGNALSSVENDTFASMDNSLISLKIDGDSTSLPPIHALEKLKIIEYLTMRHYNVPTFDQEHRFFLSFVRLKSLTLDDWQTYHMSSESFLGLNNLQSLSLLNQKLEGSLPIDVLRHEPLVNLQTLHISHSKINQVTANVFDKFTKLKNLDLSYNEINNLEENCFKGVAATLENINLQHNSLKNSIGKLAGLSGFKNVMQIDLSKNLFKTIPEMPNLDPKKPFSLLLYENEIENFQENSFKGYDSQLSNLNLEGNKICGDMPDNLFQKVTQLASLNLKNQLVGQSACSKLQLPSSLAKSASSLQNIILSGTNIDLDSMWSVIKDLKSLRKLDLKSLAIESIPDFTFEEVTALEELDLSFNIISELRQESLAGLVSLKKLNIHENGIQTIPSCLFYGFQSQKIVIDLGSNPIKCDCKIRKLIEHVMSNRIELGPTAKCVDNTPLTSLDPNKLECPPGYQDQPCSNYYTTTTIPPDPTTTLEPPKLDLHITEVNVETITASWSITDNTNLQKYGLQVTSVNSVVEFTRDNIPPSTNTYKATGLPAGTHVTTCITAYFHDNIILTKCKLNQTLNNNNPDPGGLNDDDNNPDTAIIVGCAVAGVAFIGVVVAIIILVVFRKRPKKLSDNYMPSTQPRSFAKAELPAMTDETRRFAKPKKNVNSPKQGGMQVVAISDGQTSPSARVGRANMMFEPEEGYEPMNNLKLKTDKESSLYENDHGALPPTPGQDSRPPSYPGGYYNQAFKGDKYDEIEM